MAADVARSDVEREALPAVPGVFYTYAWNLTGEVLPLPQVAEIAHAHGVPVLVDAAAEVRVHPHTLREGEEVVVAERMRDVLRGAFQGRRILFLNRKGAKTQRLAKVFSISLCVPLRLCGELYLHSLPR